VGSASIRGWRIGRLSLWIRLPGGKLTFFDGWPGSRDSFILNGWPDILSRWLSGGFFLLLLLFRKEVGNILILRVRLFFDYNFLFCNRFTRSALIPDLSAVLFVILFRHVISQCKLIFVRPILL
jgi:hypothetical protein